MIVLYTMSTVSPSIHKVTLMLRETGLPYTVRQMEKQSNGELPDDYRKINPNGTVPAILDQENGAIVFESGAILHYLAEKSGKFLPSALKARGEVFTWLMFEAANMGPTMSELFYYMLLAEREIADVHLQRYKAKVAQYCSILDQQLQGREYLCGDYSIADIALYPWCNILEDMADINEHNYPQFRNWASMISKRPAAIMQL